MRRLIGCARGSRAGGYAGVITIVATLLAAAPASASGRLSPVARQDFGRGVNVSLPATYAVPLDSKVKPTHELDAALMGSSFAHSADGMEDDPVGRAILAFMRAPREWSRVQLPQRIQATIPGAEVYVASGSENVRCMIAVRAGQTYVLPLEMNVLLWDCGMKFRNKDVPAWTPVAIYLGVAAGRAELARIGPTWRYSGREFKPSADSILLGLKSLVPPLEVGEIRTELSSRQQPADEFRVYGPGYVRKVSATFRLAGQSQRADIWTSGGNGAGGRVFPDVIGGPGIELGGLVMPGSPGDTNSDY